MTRAADAAARRRAQTAFDRPLLIEAGAGTGKTATLVARVVVWCLGPGWERAAASADTEIAERTLRRVVAITFTEAAAAEMATRVAEALFEIAEGKRPRWLDREAAALLPDGAVRKERALALVGALDHLTVRTIHAFCRRLLALHPLEAGLHPELEVDADATRADAVAREVLEAHLASALGEHLHPDYAELAAEGLGPREIHEALLALLEEGARPEDLDLAPIGAAAVAELCDALAEEAGALGGLAAPLAGDRARKGARVAESLLALARELRGPSRPRALGDLAPLAERGFADELSKLGEWARGAFGQAEEARLAPALLEISRRARSLRAGLALVRRLRPAALAAAQRLLQQLLAEAAQRLRAQGVATFGALLRDAHALLTGQPEVASRVRAEIDQLLVDEFQDTDALQCELLEALALGPGAGPCLFLVGDPKQSIYGWRNADLAAYERMRERVRAQGELGLLSVNRRSAPAVLAEVDRLLATVMQEAPGLQPAYEKLEEDPERARTPGFAAPGSAAVEHWLTHARSADGSLDEGAGVGRRLELEAEALAADLVRLRARGVPLADVGVLCRATTAFEPVLSALRRAGIPFVVERETAHVERREVVEATAFLRCVLDPHDQVALVAALRSPAVGVPDAALLPLWRRGFPGRAAVLGTEPHLLAEILQLVAHAAREIPSDAPGVERLAGFERSLGAFLCGLDRLRRSFAVETPERFLERFRETFLLEVSEAGRFLGAHRLASVERWLRDVAAALESLDGSARALVAALRRSGGLPREHEEGRPRRLADGAVHVLTIHRAKGLEFAHVYLIQAHRSDKGRPKRETRVLRRRGLHTYELLGFPAPGLWRARSEGEAVEACERVRLLYVAATRAKERLVLSWSRRAGAPPAPSEAKGLADLIAQRAGLPDPAELAAAGGRATDAAGVLFRLPAWESRPAAAPRPAATARASQADAERIARDSAQLAAHARSASLREARPVYATASSLAHAALEEREGADDEPEARAGEQAPRERRVAMAAGTAVHAALERADSAAAGGELFAAGERAIAASLAALEPAAERAAALASARESWRAFCASSLCARWRELAPRIVARELPILLAPGEGETEPVGFVSGAIDLLARDARGDFVVIDYKTDAVAGAELARRARAYAPQGRAYCAALQRALGLAAPPRFELWFLRAGEAVAPSEAQ